VSPCNNGPGPAVCHVSTVHPALDKRVFYRECLSLVEAGYQVHLVVQHDRDEVVQGVRIHALPQPPDRVRRMLWWPWLAYRKVLAIRPRPALVHVHDPELLPVAQLLRLRGMQAVFDAHENVVSDIEYKRYLPAPVRWPLARTYEFAERFLTSGIGVIAVIETMARLYREPRTVVRNLPRLGLGPEPDPIEFRPPWRFVYTGYVTPERGALRMLQLMEDLRERGIPAQLRIVGAVVPASWRDEVLRYIEGHGLREVVTMTGEVSQQQSLAEVNRAHIGLCLLDAIPNFVNSLPVKLCEYMRYGRPVVASDITAWREFVEDVGAGVRVDINDRKQIADVVVRMLAHPEEMEQMGKRALAAVKGVYCWEKEQGRLIAFYSRLLGRRGCRWPSEPGAATEPA
jgi:hypothetical protein